MLLGSRPSIFVVDQVATSTSTSILMLLGYGPFVFLIDQITTSTSTSTSILMMLGSRPFVVVDQVVATFLCHVGFWGFYFIVDQIAATS
jgi:hypothetical protein